MKKTQKVTLQLGVSMGTAVLIFLALFAALNPSVLAAPDGSNPQILVNEFYRDGNLTTTNEWIEVVLVQDLTAAELEGFYIGDSTSATAAKYSAYQFTGVSAIASTFPKGTIIVIGGDTAFTEDASYDPENGDWNIFLNTSGSYLVNANAGSNGDIAGTDVIYVDTANSGDTISADGFAVNWDATPGTFGANADVLITAPANVTGVVLNSDLAGATTAGNWGTSIDPTSLTPGAPNGGDNSTYINDLRALSGKLTAVKTVSPDISVPYQSAVTYTIVLHNSYIYSETAVLFTDTLPISTTFNSWIEQPAGAAVNNDEITWTGTVTNGESITFTFTADQTGDYGQTIINTAAYSGTTSAGTAEAAFTVESLSGDVTFVYHDLEDVVQPGESVYLAGDFNAWDTTSTPLTADAGFETFSTTVTAVTAGTNNYKYIVYTDTVANGIQQWDWLNTNDRSYNVLGTATVDDYRNVVPSYAVLSGPATLAITQTFAAGPITGELYINNVTNPDGEGRGLKAQVGFGNSTDPGAWTWFDAVYAGQNGNNDLFEGSIIPYTPGVYSYTNRFNGNWGTGNPNSVWTYGDLDGVYPGEPFELTNTGVITAEAAAACDINPTYRIHDIQGPGSSTPINGTSVTVNAVVVGDYQVGGYNGFYIQEMDQNVDANPATSEGVFVYYPANTVDVSVGDVVYVAGTAGEFNGQTQITSVTAVNICSSSATVTPATIDMPFTNSTNLEWVEGMAVTFPDKLTVTDNYNMGRYGEVYLSSNGRQMQYAHLYTPDVAGYAAYEAEQALNRILIDDGRTDQNPLVPMPYLDPDGTLRAGSTITNMTGVMGYGFSAYRIQPTGLMTFTQSNPRENTAVNGSLKFASLNVLNYFTTIDTGAAICGPSEDMECRGADTLDELNRQRAKLVSAITGLDADVIGLIEIENNVNDDALIDLVDSLNAEAGAGTYSYIDTGTIGTDAIKVALIYKPAKATPFGSYAILDDSFDPAYQDNLNRPSLAQTFVDPTTNGRVTVSVNHLKSKGCGGETGGDVDQLDGQGCWNATRTAAAQILADWLATDPTGSGYPNFLIMGDLNSYAMEDPITALKDAGFVNLLDAFLGIDAYSYSFNGEFGYLDYALASPGLAPFVTDTAEWHINSDEPRALDYNNFNQPFFFNPDQYRASDHDPVLVGIDLPTISIVSPTEGEVFTSTNGLPTAVPVTVATTNFNIPADGHWHVWVDGAEIGPVLAYTTTVDLLPGSHVITAELRSPSHLPLGPVASVSVTVNIQYVVNLPIIMKP
ncbi:MAG: ExeM/NucH family extracellular endonuclease [Ardenticatenaceae bacterium]|nr:ExeM/NucH family extracellular endonuclease [Ardenticatenaceae bacterium]MCB8986305.1 ExeM/NucH family extracellular endonuclease [Ardenticatenaceae bacterium]